MQEALESINGSKGQCTGEKGKAHIRILLEKVVLTYIY